MNYKTWSTYFVKSKHSSPSNASSYNLSNKVSWKPLVLEICSVHLYRYLCISRVTSLPYANVPIKDRILPYPEQTQRVHNGIQFNYVGSFLYLSTSRYGACPIMPWCLLSYVVALITLLAPGKKDTLEGAQGQGCKFLHNLLFFKAVIRYYIFLYTVI